MAGTIIAVTALLAAAVIMVLGIGAIGVFGYLAIPKSA